MKYIRKIYKQLTIIVIFFIGLLLYNNIANIHHHILPNGDFVVHAHPFSSNKDTDPSNTHSHSDSDIAFIFLINNILLLVVVAAILTFFLKVNRIKFFITHQILLYYFQTKFLFNLRAPPFNF
ncbi:MAG: hypothetical protein JXA68_07550 [Ignavibacteriales bacterium]|nr:hypothetical protein [Ignavibacteriales bacterium]